MTSAGNGSGGEGLCLWWVNLSRDLVQIRKDFTLGFNSSHVTPKT